MSEKANEPQPQHQVVWGASAIGKVVGLSRPQTFRMLEAGLLSGKEVRPPLAIDGRGASSGHYARREVRADSHCIPSFSLGAVRGRKGSVFSVRAIIDTERSHAADFFRRTEAQKGHPLY